MMPHHPERQYLALLSDLLKAPERPDRTGVGTKGFLGDTCLTFDLAHGIPLLTTKKLPFRVIALELLWFLSGSTNARWLEDQGVTIWSAWGDRETREMGPIYGRQWRSWPRRRYTQHGDCGPNPVDQIAGVLDSLRKDPYGRRHIVSAWNPAEIDDMALPPCHCLFQFYVEADERLSLKLYQRSADVFLGVPFNIASYALLLSMFARVLDREPGRFVWTGGDVHLYLNHQAQAAKQMWRQPRPFPRLDLAQREDLDSWSLGDFTLSGYEPHAHLAGEVAV
jgi:thymidylate synthase